MPKINIEAESLQDLLDWNGEDIFEPVLTCHIPSEELLKMKETKMSVHKVTVHGQSIERVVQIVTKASGSVFGEDRRDGFIHAMMPHRKLAPSLESKRELQSLLL